MRQKPIAEIVREFSKSLPHFPDGRIDYSTSSIAPILMIFVKVDQEFLLSRRSKEVFAYPGKWGVNAGFLDDEKPIPEKVMEELIDELGVAKDRLKELIKEIKIHKYFEFKDEKTGMTWIKTPVIVELTEKPEIHLDWEHDECRWIRIEELSRYDTVVDLERTLKCAL